MVVPAELADEAAAAAAQERTVVLAGWDGHARAVLAVTDQLKPHAVAAVARIRGLGLRPFLLTGDNERTAHAVAAQLGIPARDVFAGIGPEGKAGVIAGIQASGCPVAFVGDGVNDAPALAQARLGMAIGTGTDAAIGAADLTLTGGDPSAAADAVQLAWATSSVIRANLVWACAYNVIALPAAALGYLNPLFAGIAMSASSLFVVANSLRLRRYRPGTWGREPAGERRPGGDRSPEPSLAEAGR
jgi:Cu+-exporting ATPase